VEDMVKKRGEFVHPSVVDVCDWRRGSVVRTSVSGRRTFPDMCPIYAWQVTTLWVYCPLWVSHLLPFSLPSVQPRWMYLHRIRVWDR